MPTLNDEPSQRKPEPFPDWKIVGRMLSAVAVCAMLGVVFATILGLLETPTERRRRVKFEAYEQEQIELLRRSEEEAKASEKRLKVLEREIFGDRK